MRFDQTATLDTSRGTHTLRLRTARSFWGRFRGLMLSRPLDAEPVPQGLFIPRCPSVHGFFMRYALDVVYLANHESANTGGQQAQLIVTHTHQLKPWRLSFGQRWHRTGQDGHSSLSSQHALELPAGSIQTLCIAPGDALEIRP
jgi:uncharacterized membrane protein (UPF0127 family)